MRAEAKKDLFFISVIFAVSALIVSSFRLGYLPSVILFFGLPSFYISYRYKEIIKKTLMFSAIFSIP